MNLDTVENLYRAEFPTLQETAEWLLHDLRSNLSDVERIDAISCRAKSVERFVEKASRLRQDNSLKYQFPLEEIQDQVGARVVVFYLSDVARVTRYILEHYRVVENQVKEESDPWRFGYQAQHFVCFFPPELPYTDNLKIKFFELQISTLFQHAWAEANHDLAYKKYSPLTEEQSRKIAWAAAQAWGADTIFDEIFTTEITELE